MLGDTEAIKVGSRKWKQAGALKCIARGFFYGTLQENILSLLAEYNGMAQVVEHLLRMLKVHSANSWYSQLKMSGSRWCEKPLLKTWRLLPVRVDSDDPGRTIMQLSIRQALCIGKLKSVISLLGYNKPLLCKWRTLSTNISFCNMLEESIIIGSRPVNFTQLHAKSNPGTVKLKISTFKDFLTWSRLAEAASQYQHIPTASITTESQDCHIQPFFLGFLSKLAEGWGKRRIKLAWKIIYGSTHFMDRLTFVCHISAPRWPMCTGNYAK